MRIPGVLYFEREPYNWFRSFLSRLDSVDSGSFSLTIVLAYSGLEFPGVLYCVLFSAYFSKLDPIFDRVTYFSAFRPAWFVLSIRRLPDRRFVMRTRCSSIRRPWRESSSTWIRRPSASFWPAASGVSFELFCFVFEKKSWNFALESPDDVSSVLPQSANAENDGGRLVEAENSADGGLGGPSDQRPPRFRMRWGVEALSEILWV